MTKNLSYFKNVHFYICLLLIVFISCEKKPKYPADSGLSAKELMNGYCSSCHMMPNPNELDKTTWQSHVLPRMGYMLGFRNLPDSLRFPFEDFAEGEKISEATSIYLAAKSPVMSKNDWQKLQEHIITLAPEELSGNSPEIVEKTTLFEIQKVEMPFLRPATTLTTFVAPGKILAADANRGILMHFDEKVKLTKYDSLGPNIVQAQKHDNRYWLTHMGDVFTATDAPNGYISCYTEEGYRSKPIENLTRPVDVAFGDITGDGNSELVISEFGKWTGKLSLWKKVNDTYVGEDLLNLPGAIKSEIIDLNNDNKKDIVALFGQAKEAIYAFYNQGNGTFKKEQLLHFPSTYGSTYFTMVDYNKDGNLDILYTAGDNGDYPSIAKPYHGIRIFLNDGKNHFKETLFIPLNGVYKSILTDFDLDGDEDFATICYFPKNENEYFVFLENEGTDTFTPKFIENDVKGQWLTMDSLDYDLDGDVDLVLGSYNWGQNSQNVGYIVPLVYLTNKTIHKEL